MDIYEQISVKIIQSQEGIIGPVAIERAMLVNGMTLQWDNHEVSIEGEKVKAVEDLIEQYKELFGEISVQVSKEAVKALMLQLPADKVPHHLK
ncbi:MAG: hypothetical protein ABIV43_00800 [Candidatus Saccharimonadales bacterium]